MAFYFEYAILNGMCCYVIDKNFLPISLLIQPFLWGVLAISRNIKFCIVCMIQNRKNVGNKLNQRIVGNHSDIVLVISITFSALWICGTLISLVNSNIFRGCKRQLICGLGVKIAVFLDIWLWASRIYMSLSLLHCPFTYFNFYRIS